jgi:serine/threonine-protein kinase
MTMEQGDHPRIPGRIPTAPELALSWELLEERGPLGSGETADVVEMHVAGAGESVAVKQPRLESTLQSETVEQFVAEAETWSKLDDHDHIVGVVDWGETPLPWIALEHMDGGSLGDRLGRLSTEEGLWIGICAADGVWSAHRQGVAHLDLKPENVLFRTTETGVWDVPKVSDWGLARLLLEESTDVEGLSPRYASPEQFQPDTYGRPDDRSDVYQLGTIVYELLTGEPVFDGAARTVMERHVSESPTPPTDVDATLPAAADDVVLGALAKEKGDRYESMLDFRRALEGLFDRIASGAPGSSGRDDHAAGPTSSGDRLDPLESGPGSTDRDRRAAPASDGLGAGSSIGAGSDGTRILDRIREQTRVEHEQRVPWQQRDDAPGLRATDADDAPDEQPAVEPADVNPTPDATTGGDETTAAAVLYGTGLVVGLFVSMGAVVGGVPPALLVGVPMAAGCAWKLSAAAD